MKSLHGEIYLDGVHVAEDCFDPMRTKLDAVLFDKIESSLESYWNGLHS